MIGHVLFAVAVVLILVLAIWGAVALTVWMLGAVGVPLTILCLTAALLALATL